MRSHATPAAPAARRRGRAPERYYVGRRQSPPRVYVIDRVEVKPLVHLHYRGDADFDWGRFSDSDGGRLSDGALELAFALLCDAAASRPPEPVCQVFCEAVLADLPEDGFVLAHGQVALWLLAARGAACRGGSADFLPRAVRSFWRRWIDVLRA